MATGEPLPSPEQLISQEDFLVPLDTVNYLTALISVLERRLVSLEDRMADITTRVEALEP